MCSQKSNFFTLANLIVFQSACRIQFITSMLLSREVKPVEGSSAVWELDRQEIHDRLLKFIVASKIGVKLPFAATLPRPRSCPPRNGEKEKTHLLFKCKYSII
jgi:hypothetical protein